MTIGRHRADSSQDDELVSQLYQQVTEQQAARFAAGHDTAAGLARYRDWLGEHTAEEQAEPPAVPGPMTTLPGFTVEIDQNPYLPVGGQDVSAIVTVTANKQLPDVDDVSLRIWTPQGASTFLKQVAPAVEDLTSRRTESDPQVGDYPTGAWGPGESRDYHLAVRVPRSGAVGDKMLAARVSLVAASPNGPEVLGEKYQVVAIWTDDEALSTRINQNVAHYTGQEELAQAIQEGLEARRQGDTGTAEARLGRAVALAHQSGNEETAKLLLKVVDVVDAATGTVQLKKKVEDADEMALDTRSTKTVRTKK